VALAIGALFWLIPEYLLAVFGMSDPQRRALATNLLRFLSVSGLFVTVALSYTGGLQGTGDTRSPLYISIVSQVIVPLGFCTILQATRGLPGQRHLARHRARPHDALSAQFRPLPPAEMARHRSNRAART
jgi:Na+-driven multidrug efflux pump